MFLESSLFWRLILGRCICNGSIAVIKIFLQLFYATEFKILTFFRYSNIAVCFANEHVVDGGENKHGLSLEATQQLETAATLINSIITFCTQRWAISLQQFFLGNILQIYLDSPSETKFVFSCIKYAMH